MKKVLLAISFVVLLVLLGGMVYKYNQSEKQKNERFSGMQEEAEVWEKEITAIQQDLSERKAQIKTVEIVPSVVIVGFMPTSAADVEEINKMIQECQAAPVVVINCSLESEEIEAILQSLSYEDIQIVLTGDEKEIPSAEKVSVVENLINQYYGKDASAYLLRIQQDTTDNQAKVPDVPGLFRYSDYYAVGTYEDGRSYGSYLFMRDNSEMKSYIKEMEVIPTVTILVVDYQAILDGMTDAEEITDIIAFVQEERASGLLQECSIDESMDLITESMKTIEQRQQDYDNYSAEQQIRIDELNEKIRNVCEKWN